MWGVLPVRLADLLERVMQSKDWRKMSILLRWFSLK